MIAEWIKEVKKTTSPAKPGFQYLILTKWKSFMQHESNKHKNHSDELFAQCAHDNNIEHRKSIKVGMLAIFF